MAALSVNIKATLRYLLPFDYLYYLQIHTHVVILLSCTNHHEERYYMLVLADNANRGWRHPSNFSTF